MLKRKRVWIPILIVLLAAIGCGLFYERQVSKQEPVKVYTPVTPERVAKLQPTAKSPASDTSQGGHFHADGTWHTEAHETSETAQPSGETQSDGVWYPDNYTQADIAADLAGEGAATDEEYKRRFTKHWVNNYLRRHREEYPDCTEHEAVLADAIRQAEWRFADQAYMDKDSELTDEFTTLMDELQSLFEKYNYRPAYEATHIPESERLKDTKRIKDINAQLDEHSRRRAALNRENPIYPKPLHTH